MVEKEISGYFNGSAVEVSRTLISMIEKIVKMKTGRSNSLRYLKSLCNRCHPKLVPEGHFLRYMDLSERVDPRIKYEDDGEMTKR